MVIFRENTEDIYAGIEFEAGSDAAKKILAFLEKEFPKDYKKIRFPATTGIGIKPVIARGHRAPRARGDRVRARQQEEERHVRPQGQHHEVHRGRLHEVGLRARREGVRRQGLHLGHVGEDQGGQGRRRGQRRAEGGARGGQDPRQGRDRRHHAAAGAHPPEGVRRHRDAEPERRLPLRRARGAGRRHRHRARRQHQLRHRPRHLRGDARHGAEVRRPRQGQPRQRHPLAAR